MLTTLHQKHHLKCCPEFLHHFLLKLLQAKLQLPSQGKHALGLSVLASLWKKALAAISLYLRGSTSELRALGEHQEFPGHLQGTVSPCLLWSLLLLGFCR